MKATDVLRLDAEVKKNKTDIKINRRTLPALADELTKKLGVKVGMTALREVLIANGIETRRPGKKDATIDGLREQVQTLRGLLQELKPHASGAPAHLLGRIDNALVFDAAAKSA